MDTGITSLFCLILRRSLIILLSPFKMVTFQVQLLEEWFVEVNVLSKPANTFVGTKVFFKINAAKAHQ